MGYSLLSRKYITHVNLICNLLIRRGLANNVIQKVLVANRGEIACRVTRTAKRLGIKVVAVYSDADRSSLHVSMADEAYHIGPAASAESYLRVDKLLAVARSSGSQAIHPGYGFLSENAEFAEKCRQEGIIFIGPPASAIRDMGCKSTSKKIMEVAGVPVIKGYHGDKQDNDTLKLEAKKIGYPVMLKALKGGGGKGMRIVLKESDFEEQLASARNEAAKSFGDTAMLVEAFVIHPRHVEVQVFGDKHGNYVHLHERDCSVQRRHQKVIEEAPAPGLNEEIRSSLGKTAVTAAQSVGYEGAGTVEFILDADTNQHYFMEMNTRLQVEHPVTEMITGTDLVEWQFRVASGESLPLKQHEISVRGHAFEARVYAEDPKQGFLPQAGTLHHLSLPLAVDNVRIDTGVRAADQVPVFYDPLIAKLIAWGPDRNEALKTLQDGLTSFQVSGVPTNINFLLSLARHREFQSGKVHTNFISKHDAELLAKQSPTQRMVATVVAAKLFSEALDTTPNDPFKSNPGFRVNHNFRRDIHFVFEDMPVSVGVEYLRSNELSICYDAPEGSGTFVITHECKITENGDITVQTVVNGHVERANVFINQSSIQIFSKDGESKWEIPEPKWIKLQKGAEDSGIETLSAASPMPGVVDQILVNPGDTVIKNQPVATVIAMKMEYTVRAPSKGIVEEIIHKSGDAVSKGAILIRVNEEAAALEAKS